MDEQVSAAAEGAARRYEPRSVH